MALACSQAGDQKIGVLIVRIRRHVMLPRDLRDEWIEMCKKLTMSDLSRHADVGSLCRCRECFCCIAKSVYQERSREK